LVRLPLSLLLLSKTVGLTLPLPLLGRADDVEAIETPVHETADIEAAIDQISRQPNGGLIFPSDTFARIRSEGIVKLAHDLCTSARGVPHENKI
jgi:hypothetical protein